MRAFIALFLVLLSAHATGQNLYVYGALGLTGGVQVDKSQRDQASGALFSAQPQGGPPDESLVSEEGTVGKLQIGYQLAKRIAVELGAADYGKATYFARRTVRVPPDIFVFTNQEEWRASGYNVAAVGNLPIGAGFSLLGKAGAARVKVHYKRSTQSAGIFSSQDVNDTHWAPNYGVGLQYDVAGRFPIGHGIAFRLEFERVRDVGSDDAGGKRNVDMSSFGVLLKF